MVRRRGLVVHHADLSDPVRPPMAHGELGDGGGLAAVVVPARAASGVATHGPRAVSYRLRAAVAQSGGVRRLPAQWHRDPELAFVCLRLGGGRAVCRRHLVHRSGRAVESVQATRRAVRAGRNPVFPAAQHRDRRLFHPPGRPLHRVPFRWKLRAGHDLQHRLGTVFAGIAGDWNLETIQVTRASPPSVC